MNHVTKNHDMEYYLLCKKINQSEKDAFTTFPASLRNSTDLRSASEACNNGVLASFACRGLRSSEFSSNIPPITKHGILKPLYEDLVQSFSRTVIDLPKTISFQTRSVAKLPAELVVEGFQPSDQDGKYMNLIPSEIRSHIPVLKSRSQYSFATPGGRNITVCIACYHDYSLEHADMVQQIYSWFCFLEKHARPICSKNLTVYLYLTKYTKTLPKTKNTELSEIHVNSGFTTSCPQHDNEIYIYRYEEWLKVFIHETIHALGIDFSWYRNQAPIENILRNEFTGVQTTQWNISECYTEVWAEICNILIQVYRITKNPKFAQIQSIVQTALMYESCWSRIQCCKVLQHYSIRYQELKDEVKASDENSYVRRTGEFRRDVGVFGKAREVETSYQETNTSVFTYYVLKCVLMTHLDLFLDWCSQALPNNPMLFTKIFDGEKTIESRMISFGNFLVQQSRKMDFYLTIVSEELTMTKKPSFAMNSMRMSLWG